MLATVKTKHQIEVRDYSNKHCDLSFTVTDPFGSAEIGRISLKDKRLAVVSKDGTLINIYNISASDSHTQELLPIQRLFRGQSACKIYDPL